MDPGGLGGAFGGVKAGGAQDPLTYVKRPAVVIRICALVRISLLIYQKMLTFDKRYTRTCSNDPKYACYYPRNDCLRNVFLS